MSYYWTVFPEWAGETAYLIGGGPSLRGMDLSMLRSRRVIVINDAYTLVPNAEYLYFCDLVWWYRCGNAVEQKFDGNCIVTLESQILGVERLRNTGPEGLETDPQGLRHGCNSGYQAINLAYHLGAKRIVLLGYDMQVSGSRVHFHNNTWAPPAIQQSVMKNSMLPKFRSLVEPLKLAGVEVLNATPGSALREWPMVQLADTL